MKIHVVHSSNYDFKNELYNPLRNSNLNQLHKIFLPHETDEFIKTKDLIRNCDVVVAEVSLPATGLGIELGWADAFDRPIICISKHDSKVSGSLKAVSNVFIEYLTSEDLVAKLSRELAKIKV